MENDNRLGDYLHRFASEIYFAIPILILFITGGVGFMGVVGPVAKDYLPSEVAVPGGAVVGLGVGVAFLLYSLFSRSGGNTNSN